MWDRMSLLVGGALDRKVSGRRRPPDPADVMDESDCSPAGPGVTNPLLPRRRTTPLSGSRPVFAARYLGNEVAALECARRVGRRVVLDSLGRRVIRPEMKADADRVISGPRHGALSPARRGSGWAVRT